MTYLRQIKRKYDYFRDRLRVDQLKEKRETLRKGFQNKKIIILSSDCVGGMLMKDYGLPCYSPTVNIWYPAEDFIKLCENPSAYFEQPFENVGTDIGGEEISAIVGDISCHCGHDPSFEVAKKRWDRGCSLYKSAIRGSHEVCVIQNDRNGFHDSLIERFENLPYRHKILFTHKKWDAPHTFYMEGEDDREFVDVMTLFESYFSIHRRYERFDFFHWFLDMCEGD